MNSKSKLFFFLMLGLALIGASFGSHTAHASSSSVAWTGNGLTGGVGSSACNTSNSDLLAPVPAGQKGWLFVLSQISGTPADWRLNVDFGPGTANDQLSIVPVQTTNNVAKWAVYSAADATLDAATAFATGSGSSAGGNLVVSHCYLGTTQKLDSTTMTTIHDAAENAVLEVDLGASVHDSATVTGSGPQSTGTVDFVFYTNAACSADGVAAGSGIPLVNGVADGSLSTLPLAAGAYSFKAHYSGDANYNPSDGACEPLTVKKGDLNLSTTIYNAADNSVVTGHLPLGSSAFDTVSFGGAVDGFTPDASQVSYTFNGSAAGSGAWSLTQGPLSPGHYVFVATFAGDANYNPAVGPDEPLDIDKGNLTISTTIYNADDNSIVTGPLPLGSSVYDTMSFDGAVEGFAPDTSKVSYTFNGAAAGGGPQSSTQGPLAAGSYVYVATFAGDDNYNAAVGPDEPLAINQAQLTITTQVHNARHFDVTGTVVAPGSIMHDTALVDGAVAGFPIPVISFMLNGVTVANAAPEVGYAARSVDSAPLGAGSYVYRAAVAGDSNYIGATAADEPFSVPQLGLTMGFWGNNNGQARINARGGYAANAIGIGRGSNIDTQAEALKVLPSTLNACGKSATVIFNGQNASTNCSLASGVNANSLNTLSGQTLALGYNLRLVAGYNGQSIAGLVCTAYAAGAGLTSANTVYDVFTAAAAVIDGSASGGSTVQAQVGALNLLLGCLNREGF